MGVVTTVVVLVASRETPWKTVTGVSWSVLPLVAGLFVLVEALTRTGLIADLSRLLARLVEERPDSGPWIVGGTIAVVSNLMNLPAGLIASSVVPLVNAPNDAPAKVVDALLIGVDLGPNLSVTGSLATILWLTAIRREGENVGWKFLRLGAV